VDIIFNHECKSATASASSLISHAYTVVVDGIKDYTGAYFSINEPSGIQCIEYRLNDFSSPPNPFSNSIISLKPNVQPPTLVVGPTAESHLGNV